MVKMNIHLESEDLQISKLNEIFLVADRIKKAGRSARQGFGKFKNKTNPNGGGARLSVPSSGENAPFTNESFTSVASIVQSSRTSPSAPSDSPSGNPFSKKKRKTIRAHEVPAVPSNPARCPAPDQITQAISERSDEERAKVTANGHFRKSSPQTSWRKLHRVRSRRLANLLLHRYSPLKISLSLASQNPFLRSLGKGWIRETGEPPPQGKWHVATPLWPSVRVKPNTWKSWRLRVFRDSRMFRAQQQGAKHLALGCSWCHSKGLET
jgi:hypothetical protein